MLMSGFLVGCWTLAINLCYSHLAIFLAVVSEGESTPYNLLCCDCCNHACYCT